MRINFFIGQAPGHSKYLNFKLKDMQSHVHDHFNKSALRSYNFNILKFHININILNKINNYQMLFIFY